MSPDPIYGDSKSAVYGRDVGIPNLNPFVQFVVRCIEHDESAGCMSEDEARSVMQNREVFCSGCGWNGEPIDERVLQFGIDWPFRDRSPEPFIPQANPIVMDFKTRKADREPRKCDFCGIMTRKRWEIIDGHEWLVNGIPVDKLKRVYCSVSCAKGMHSDRVKSAWSAHEVMGGR